MPIEKVTVFGGTGFLGRRIVERLRRRGLQVRVASRSVAAAVPAGPAAENFSPVRADLRDAASVAAAVAGVDAAVNAVGLYVERGAATFQAIHVEGAKTLAAACRQQGIERLVHLSGIGADPEARSPYVRARGQGEAAVRDAFGEASILRPSVLFADDDAFLSALLSLVRRAPVIPLFGDGGTLLQPVFADDVAEAVARILTEATAPAPLYTLGGPQVFTYRQILERLMAHAGRRPVLLPLPFALWEALAAVAGLLPAPPLTEGQVALMKRHNIVPSGAIGFETLGITPTPMAQVLERFQSAPGLC